MGFVGTDSIEMRREHEPTTRSSTISARPVELPHADTCGDKAL